MKNLITKLHGLQKAIGAINKDSKNPFYNSQYFNINKLLEVLKPELTKLGLVIIQPVEIIDGRSVLSTVLYDSESGESIKGSIILPDNLEPQKVGSCITYYRRYSLQSFLLLQAEDDDAQKTVPAGKPISTPAGKAFISATSQCSCGGAVEEFSGVSATTKKPFVKLTCQSCGKVSWK